MRLNGYKYKVVYQRHSQTKAERSDTGSLLEIARFDARIHLRLAGCDQRRPATKAENATMLCFSFGGITSTFLWLKTRGSSCWRGTNSEAHDFWHTNWPQDFGPNHRTNRNKSREFAMLKRDQLWSDSSWPASEAMSREGCMAYQPSWGLDFVEKSWCRCRCQTTEWSCLIILVGPLPRFWPNWIHPHLGHRFLWSLQCFALPWLFCGSWLFQPMRRRRTRVMGTIPCLGRKDLSLF